MVSGISERVLAPGPILSQFLKTLFVIASTANVAIPAARPERRMIGIPTRNANTPPTTAAMASEAALPTWTSWRNPNNSGNVVGFTSAGAVVIPAANAPTATKLTWPNEMTPEFPTNV